MRKYIHTHTNTYRILALDEPTSNLDQHNIGGFTQALSRIVVERGKQSTGFQLIVISHDNDVSTNLYMVLYVMLMYLSEYLCVCVYVERGKQSTGFQLIVISHDNDVKSIFVCLFVCISVCVCVCVLSAANRALGFSSSSFLMTMM